MDEQDRKMDGQDEQIVDEEVMETAAVVPPRPGEEAGATGSVPEEERRPAGTVGD